jgi:hypothetical protein
MQPGARDGNSQVAAVEFISHEATLEKFQQEWLEIGNGKRGKKSWAKLSFAQKPWMGFLRAHMTRPAKLIKPRFSMAR